MAKGAHGGKRAGGIKDSLGNSIGNSDYSTSVTTQQGKTVALSTPLVYGEDTGKSISATATAHLDKFYGRIDKQKVEYEIVLDKDGNVIKETRGSKNSVSTKLTRDDWDRVDVATHLHPRNDGFYDSQTIGGTFSTQDIKSFDRTLRQ